MSRKKIFKSIAPLLLGISTLMLAVPSHAGLVWFSRANCVNNESITWDWPGTNYWLWTNSSHWKNGWDAGASTGWEYGFRSAAVHWGEGLKRGYIVYGNHYRFIPGYGTQYMGRTQTDNCNLGFFFPYW